MEKLINLMLDTPASFVCIDMKHFSDDVLKHLYDNACVAFYENLSGHWFYVHYHEGCPDTFIVDSFEGYVTLDKADFPEYQLVNDLVYAVDSKNIEMIGTISMSDYKTIKAASRDSTPGLLALRSSLGFVIQDEEVEPKSEMKGLKRELAVIIAKMQKKGIKFEKGLSDDEIEDIQKKFNLTFPPDLRLFLQMALPVSNNFPQWRSRKGWGIGERIDWPLEGIVFDVEHNGMWLDRWGEKPSMLEEQIKVVEEHYSSYPKLIPIYSHRYIPSAPLEMGNPVFSVVQSDIVYYGKDLCDYLRCEFLGKQYRSEGNVKHIVFWSDIAE